MVVLVYSKSARSCEFASSRSYSKSSKLLGFGCLCSGCRYLSINRSGLCRDGRVLEPPRLDKLLELRRLFKLRSGGREAAPLVRLAKLGSWVSDRRGAGSRENLRCRSREGCGGEFEREFEDMSLETGSAWALKSLKSLDSSCVRTCLRALSTPSGTRRKLSASEGSSYR